ncbi:MAG TPA: flagellar biosynthetic protein FliO [Clostridia bacterium]|nr:flagellar biosynthetic protein FliO [Clostridia bacterium]
MERLEAFSVFFSVFLTLAFVLFLAWFFLRWIGGHAPIQSNYRHIKILDRVIIDREKYLLLVSAGDKTVLIAMSAGAVETICEFSPQQRALFDAATESEQSFSAVIKQMLPKKNSSSAKGGDGL